LKLRLQRTNRVRRDWSICRPTGAFWRDVHSVSHACLATEWTTAC